MASQIRETFDLTAFQIGLQSLSTAIKSSEVLAPLRPIELVATGGYVSVAYLQNRDSSQDLDYFLDARVLGINYERVRAELQNLVTMVAGRLHYSPQWANDEVRVFLGLLEDPEQLFDLSKQQNIIVFRDENIVIYAVKWEWVLARKLKRLQMENQRRRTEDWEDCISITKLLYDIRKTKLSPSVVQIFDNAVREPPVYPDTLTELRRLVLERHKVDTFPTAIWCFAASTASFSYKWNDGTPISRDLWPKVQGRMQVYLTESQQWRVFDNDRQKWD